MRAGFHTNARRSQTGGVGDECVEADRVSPFETASLPSLRDGYGCVAKIHTVERTMAAGEPVRSATKVAERQIFPPRQSVSLRTVDTIRLTACDTTRPLWKDLFYA